MTQDVFYEYYLFTGNFEETLYDGDVAALDELHAYLPHMEQLKHHAPFGVSILVYVISINDAIERERPLLNIFDLFAKNAAQQLRNNPQEMEFRILILSTLLVPTVWVNVDKNKQRVANELTNRLNTYFEEAGLNHRFTIPFPNALKRPIIPVKPADAAPTA